MLRNNRGAADRRVPLDARHVRHPNAARKRLLLRDHAVLGRKAREKQDHEGQLRLDRAREEGGERDRAQVQALAAARKACFALTRCA